MTEPTPDISDKEIQMRVTALDHATRWAASRGRSGVRSEDVATAAREFYKFITGDKNVGS